MIASLKNCMEQKSSEYERALAAEASRHQLEMQNLLGRNNQVYSNMDGQMHFQRSTSTINAQTYASEPPKEREEQLDQRVAALQRSKENEIALIRQQVLKNKTEELMATNGKLQQLQLTTANSMDNIRDDCLELYTYVGRVVGAVDNNQS
ncbi:hypothetical protein BBO99_00001726 [Phytophthora kernoviae]|uniref:Uncharacterized protein n=2 Tax=Phytophthora kernoviae TaxID=325452 RepID=A0A3R7K8N3_9STRA|nr:hypothetical protein G195_002291 [Phytophthora kernoviae 00238/432]KAG2530960.1 hypothetical protein JM16_001424 [Phytophthora kernoviae]KAG2532039.1 hypothetical protein JM18_001505 [Phytophthora kernoviae]RLN36741.1 hypothetical protein BBI17_001521 [Phytophthora kernoviae]RLN83907.1 hypothetical protein BBO99_00001726 [Phytophthora kernoviae]